MRRDFKVFATILLIYAHLLCETSAQKFLREPDGLPCKFHDTVNISDGLRDHNHNILHNDLKYPKHLYAEYNYIIVNTTSKRSVERHTRGCICMLDKPCFRLCLPPIMEDMMQDEIFVNKSNEELEYEVTKIQNEHYNVVYGKTCDIMFEMEPEYEKDDQWVFLKVIFTPLYIFKIIG